jgi:hypothetical protein
MSYLFHFAHFIKLYCDVLRRLIYWLGQRGGAQARHLAAL